MKHTIFSRFVLFIFCIAGPVAGSDTSAFTDEDLKKYSYPSEKLRSDAQPDRETINSKDHWPVSKGKEQKQKRYAVPYIPFEGTVKRIIISVTFNNSATVPMAWREF